MSKGCVITTLSRSGQSRVVALALCALLAGINHRAPAAATYEVVHPFAVPAGNPIGELVEDGAGNFYGTTSSGGAGGAGTVFKISPSGAISTLVEFTGDGSQNKGGTPGAGLILATDGNLYGTTATGGAGDFGTVFKVTLNGALTTLVEFTGGTGLHKGMRPYASLLEASDGNFYGTTSRGGSYGYGTLFKMAPDGTLTTLVEFSSNGALNKGALPYAPLIEGQDGYLYGTTSKGGINGNGTIFVATKSGVLTTLVQFTDKIATPIGAVNGAVPYGGLIQLADGSFYGTTSQGGAKSCGTVFKMSSTYRVSTVAEFTDTSGVHPGALPEATLVLGTDGNLYGTTFQGGAKDCGTLFRYTPGGGLATLVNFTGTTGIAIGRLAQAGLTVGRDGNLHGTTFAGGDHGTGTVFRYTLGTGLSTVASFGAINHATYYHAGLTLAADGNFYGATSDNGIAGLGTIYRVEADGSVKTLVEFTGNGAANKGALPYSALIAGTDGSLYGTTVKGGANDLGTVFKVDTQGALTTLVEFTGNGSTAKGSTPGSGLVLGSDGNFYGTTNTGGAANLGTVFKLTTGGVFTTLVEFTGNGAANKGASPYAALVEGLDRNLYGTTTAGGARDYGTVFKLTKAGTLTTLAEFADGTTSNIGAYPQAALALGNDGNLYGTTATGGVTGDGSVFRITPDGTLTTLLQFTGKAAPHKGSYPKAPLVLGSDGAFYGTTGFGGVNGTGTLFRMTPDGTFKTIVEFPGSGVPNHGTYPQAGLVLGSDGNLYGAASSGGPAQAGEAFRLRIRAVPDTRGVSDVLPDFVWLNAVVKPGSLQTSAYFEFGTTTAYGSSTTPQALGSGTTSVPLTAQLSGLHPHTTYHYRVVLTDSSGTIVGADQTFTTEPMATEVISSGNVPSGEPTTSIVKSFGLPAIDDNGAVAVLANLTTAAGKDSVILAGNPPVVVVRKGQQAPAGDGTTSANRVFTSFSDPVCDNAGDLAFSAAILDGAVPHTGLWTKAGGALRQVVQVGSAAPEVAGTMLKTISSFAMSGTGQVFYVGTLAGTGVMPINNLALWSADAAGSHLLLRTGQNLAGKNVSGFNVLGPVAGSSGQGRGYQDGTAAVLVTFNDTTQAIMHFAVASAPEVVAKSGDSVAGLATGDALKLFGVPSISAGNTSAFVATMLTGAGDTTAANNQVILVDSNSQNLPVLVRKGDAAPGVSGTTFAALGNPVYNAQTNTAFIGTLAGTGVTSLNNTGIWWTSPSGLQMLARLGDQPVGVNGAKWASILSLALPDGSGPAFVARIGPGSGGTLPPNGVNATNNMGLWAVDSTGLLSLIVRAGDVMHIGGVPKTLSLITILTPALPSPGQARSYNHQGDLTFRATFTDRSQAIMRVHLP